MVVLYGSLFFIFIYLTYLTNRSRKEKHQIKQLKVAAKEYLIEIALLKAEIKHGKADEKREESEDPQEVYTDYRG
jgi:hypothetical protein